MPSTWKKSPKPSSPEWYTPYQLADLLQLHYRSVIRRCEEGTIHGVKLGANWRIPKSVVDKMASSQ